MYLSRDINKKNTLLLAGTPVEIKKKISEEPMLFSVKVNGEYYCVGADDITDKEVKKKK